MSEEVESSENSKIITYKWAVSLHDRQMLTKTNLMTSEFFKLPSKDTVLFRIYLRNETIVSLQFSLSFQTKIYVLKVGSLHPERADIRMKINESELKSMKMINWNGYSHDFRFKETCESGTVITCTIRPHEYEDFKEQDMATLSTLMLANHMSNYLYSSELSDVIIKVKNEEFPAHKIVLASHSPVFSKMFSTEMKEAKENCVDFSEFDVVVIRELTKFMYTGNIEAKTHIDVLFGLLSCADMYQMDKLNTFCQYKLIENFSVENIIKITVETERYDVPKLKERAMDFLDFNKREILFTDAINQVHHSSVLKEFFSNEMGMKN
ncbi:TD and POZ domain-containing protein 1-like [Microplitis mediator]|uniref:TD and POZ domain-containing protein 1-like n=1 Tax=Microplitis mediator TaxID=375433 RepID=UPI00255590E0|nr:TD and POZ domain-containing protein 1-like [Microplitis mediator]